MLDGFILLYQKIPRRALVQLWAHVNLCDEFARTMRRRFSWLALWSFRLLRVKLDLCRLHFGFGKATLLEEHFLHAAGLGAFLEVV